MKLQSLHESSLADTDISKFVDNVDEKYVPIIKEILSKFKAYNKVTLDDVQEDDMFFHITNGLVDFDLSFSKDDSGDEFFPAIEIASMVNHEYIYQHEKISEHETFKYALTNSFSRDFGLNRKERVLEYIDRLLEVASAFADWYFEISGEHGKVKLLKTITNLEEGSSTNVWYWTPYLGQFSVPTDSSLKPTAKAKLP